MAAEADPVGHVQALPGPVIIDKIQHAPSLFLAIRTQVRLLVVPVPALGAFKHEATAIDAVHRHIYLTEDVEEGKVYRFVPDDDPEGGRADLSRGQLEVAVVRGEDPFKTCAVKWATVPNPLPRLGGDDVARQEPPTRKQLPEAAIFNGGEGCWYFDGLVYFTTKVDNRV